MRLNDKIFLSNDSNDQQYHLHHGTDNCHMRTNMSDFLKKFFEGKLIGFNCNKFAGLKQGKALM